MRRPPLAAPLLALAALCSCAQVGLAPNEVDETVVREDPTSREPAHVVVQHVLIAQAGAELPGVTRTVAEAERLAAEVLDRARAGDAFDDLVRLYSDDRHEGGVYRIANYNAPLEKQGEVERASLVKGFGDLAFRLEVGAVDVVPYDAKRSPFGFHVVRRLQ